MGFFSRKKKVSADVLGESLLKSCWKQREAFGDAVLGFADRSEDARIQSIESTVLHLWAAAHMFHQKYPTAVEAMRLAYVATLNCFPPTLDEEEYQARCHQTDRELLHRFREYEALVPESIGIADLRRLGPTVADNLFEHGAVAQGREAEFAAYLHAYLSGWLLSLAEYLERKVTLR